MRVRYSHLGSVSVSEFDDACYDPDFGCLTFSSDVLGDFSFKIPQSYVSNILYHLLTDGYFDLCGLGYIVEEVPDLFDSAINGDI